MQHNPLRQRNSVGHALQYSSKTNGPLPVSSLLRLLIFDLRECGFLTSVLQSVTVSSTSRCSSPSTRDVGQQAKAMLTDDLEQLVSLYMGASGCETSTCLIY
jgi:hypothetical protein